MRFQWLIGAAATAVVATAAAAWAPPAGATGQALAPSVRWLGSGNYTKADRPVRSIRHVVVHVTEGGFWGSVQWLRNARSKASSHYVVGKDGTIVQLVRDSDIAWHAGNWRINADSIGIEHEGFTWRANQFTDLEYRNSARLAAFVAKRSLMPIDRSHFIGHSDVPDPNNSKLRGGFSHHSDPGPNWQWTRYLAYVRGYARGVTQPRYVGAKPAAPARPKRDRGTARPAAPGSPARTEALAVETTGIRDGQYVSGFVRWEARARGKGVSRVDFLIDGRVRATEQHEPYVYGGDGNGRWDTTKEPNGTHVLTLRVVGSGGRIAGSSLRVRVVNTAFQVAPAGVSNGQELSGSARLEAKALGADADRVEFLLDGRLVHTERQAPYTYEWDTKREPNGPHTLVIRGVARDGRVATTTLGLVVANAAPPPPPPRTHTFRVASQTLADGQTVGGRVRWEAALAGEPVEHVEFWIDGGPRWADSRAPYRFNGDGMWDTRSESPGWHSLVVRAVHRDGTVSSAGLRVLVSQPMVATTPTPAPVPTPTPPPTTPAPAKEPLALRSSIADGQTLKGALTWEATVTSGRAVRLDFSIDGRRRHTEYNAPWIFNGDGARWDTNGEQDGPHELSLRAYAADGSTVELVATVTIANAPTPTPTPPPTPSPTPTPAPAPSPTPAPLAVSLGELVDGVTVSGIVALTAAVSGFDARRVEFWLDGAQRRVEREAPYEWSWNTTRIPDGPHTVLVRAVGSRGRLATLTVTVTVSNHP